MFLRIATKAMTHRRSRLAVAIMALVVGSTITTAMLSVYYDAGRKMNRELRAYGANIMVGPKDGPLLDQSAIDGLASGRSPAEIVAAAPFLYVVAQAGRNPETLPATSSPSVQRQQSRRPIVVAGTWLDQARKASPWWHITGSWIEDRDDVTDCLVGAHLASQVGLNQNDRLDIVYGDPGSLDSTAAEGSVPVTGPADLRPGRSLALAPHALQARPSGANESNQAAPRSRTFSVAGLLDTGGPEDDQVIVTLTAAQQLSGLGGRLSAVAISASGSPAQIESLASS